jgi:hypothetical protein
MILFTKDYSQKFIRMCLIIIFLFLFTTASMAQLSGSYTIGTGGNYTTVTAAVADLNTQGVSGAVTFNILSGTYTENFEIGIVSGVSASNTITFQSQSGNAADVTLQFVQVSGSNYIVRLNNADFITFQNLTFTSLGSASYGRIFLINHFHIKYRHPYLV